MSRAFVNEDSAAQTGQSVERRISDQPNRVTTTGLAQLQARVTELERLRSMLQAEGERGDKQRLSDTERDLRYFLARLQSAEVVPPARSSEQVQIGSCVEFVDAQDNSHRVRLVGEDEADVGRGWINWGSPLGRALLNARAGDEVLWQRPAGDQTLEVIEIWPEV